MSGFRAGPPLTWWQTRRYHYLTWWRGVSWATVAFLAGLLAGAATRWWVS